VSDPSVWLAPLADAPVDERLVALAFVAGRALVPAEHELDAAIRRAQLLLATGGDPRRALELDGRAVSALAADLDEPARRAALRLHLAELAPVLAPLPTLADALARLRADDALAWRAFAAALLADSLDDVP
jgi:hypothetical protein